MLNKLRDSIYGPRFYGNLPNVSLGSCLGYFFLLILAATILRVAVVTGPTIAGMGGMLQSVLAEAAGLYPSELRINVDNGRVTTNVREPYFIQVKDPSWTASGYKNLLVIDTRTPFSGKQFGEYQTFAWLTRDALFVDSGKRADMRAIDLSQFGSLQIDRSAVDGCARAVEPWLGFVGPALGIGAFLVFFFASTFRLVHLFVLALLIWILAKLLRKPVGSGASYKIGLYAMTLPILVELAIDLSQSWLHLSGFPFMFSLLTLAIALVNLVAVEKRPVPEPQVTS